MTRSPPPLEAHACEPGTGWLPVARLLAGPALLLACIWLALFSVHAALPFLRPGADVILAEKARAIRAAPIFRPDARVRLAVFGNSKTLTGFRPRQFDALSGGTVSSYNFGLPAQLGFAGNLAQLCERGECPTHVALMFPWPDAKPAHPDFLHPGIEDRAWIETLFPFRHLPRDALVFAVRAGQKGGLAAFYDQARQESGRMLEERGYYFIEGQSHYPGHRLPEGFGLHADTPSRAYARIASTEAAEYRALGGLIARFGIKVRFVPAYFREGEFAPPPEPTLSSPLGGADAIPALGPDYWLMPNRLFSDALHLNPEGASVYTDRLWSLLAPDLALAARP